MPPWLRAKAPLLAAILLLAVAGGPPGRIVALCLLPRLAPAQLGRRRGREPRWRPGRDVALAGACGLGLALACQFLWAPSLIVGFETTSSDTAEHFWLLHHMGNPYWAEWSPNRYPLPALLARGLALSGNVYRTWYLAAVVSVGFVGAGLFLWGRAVAGIGAGLAAVLLVGAVPDLVLLARTVNAYPEIVALWTLGAGLAAYALRYPHPWTALAAGVGCAGVFASDPRGIVLGPLVLVVALAAAIGNRGALRRGLALAAVLAPIGLSFGAHALLPVELFSLEQRIESSIQTSYRRAGEQPPPMAGVTEGYVWGKSNPLRLPATVGRLRSARARMNPDAPGLVQQRRDVAQRVQPLVPSLVALGGLGLLLGGGALPGWRRRRDGAAWRRWLDPRGRLGLLPVVASGVLLIDVLTFEYARRFVALAAPGFVLLAGVGVLALSGRDRPVWVAPLVAALLLAVGGPLSVRAAWRLPVVSAPELRPCVETARGRSSVPPSQDVRNCAQALQLELPYAIASPYWGAPEGDAPPAEAPPPPPARW